MESVYLNTAACASSLNFNSDFPWFMKFSIVWMIGKGVRDVGRGFIQGMSKRTEETHEKSVRVTKFCADIRSQAFFECEDGLRTSERCGILPSAVGNVH
jgi:hypothetical protein